MAPSQRLSLVNAGTFLCLGDAPSCLHWLFDLWVANTAAYSEQALRSYLAASGTARTPLQLDDRRLAPAKAAPKR